MSHTSSPVYDRGPRQYASGSVSGTHYTVAQGDTWTSIGQRFGLPYQQIASANNMQGENPIIHPGDRLFIPGLNQAPPPVTDRGPRQYAMGTVSGGRYTVAQGDTWTSIGQRFGLPWQQIASANNKAGPNPVIHPGDRLIIPGLDQSPPPPVRDRGPRTHARGTVSGSYYIVAQGDTWTSIGQRFGLPWKQIASANNMAGPNPAIHPGDRLFVPGLN